MTIILPTPVKCQISSGKIAHLAQKYPFFTTFFDLFTMGFQNFEKKFSGWVWKKRTQIWLHPPPCIFCIWMVNIVVQALTCNRLHMQNVPFANVERLKKRAQSGSWQSAGIRSGRAKVSTNFAPQSSFANKPICFIN